MYTSGLFLIALCFGWGAAGLGSARASETPAATLAVTTKAVHVPGLGVLDSIVRDAIHDDQTPGAVLLVWHDGQVIYRKAFGNRALEPRKEAMTVDTIFDIASLTKVVATTTAVMQLVQKGEVRLNDPVAKYIPEFAQNGKEDITVRNLLTHFSGLRADIDLTPPWDGRDSALRLSYAETPEYSPGSRFLYSDTNFITLAALVERVSGSTLDAYCARKIFAPLRMTHTRFLPPAAWRRKIAPTEYDEQGKMLRGIVHDPRARRMGGVAGHAGLFSTADDLSRFAQALLNGSPILAPEVVEKMTTPQQPPTATVSARPGMGYRFSVFQQPWRPFTRGIVRAHRVHRHFDMDRSDHANVCHYFCQLGSSPREGNCGRAAFQGCHCRGSGSSHDGQRKRRIALEEHHRL